MSDFQLKKRKNMWVSALCGREERSSPINLRGLCQEGDQDVRKRTMVAVKPWTIFFGLNKRKLKCIFEKIKKVQKN